MFYGVFIIDLVHSSNLLVKIKKFADENEVIVHIEKIKAEIIRIKQERKEKNNSKEEKREKNGWERPIQCAAAYQ